MKHLLLIYSSDDEWAARPESERKAIVRRYGELAEEARREGRLVDGAEVQPAASATTVRIRDDETLVGDGPYEETKEQLGGFFVLDCETIDEALAFAARLPGAEDGRVEVRPASEEAQG